MKSAFRSVAILLAGAFALASPPSAAKGPASGGTGAGQAGSVRADQAHARQCDRLLDAQTVEDCDWSRTRLRDAAAPRPRERDPVRLLDRQRIHVPPAPPAAD